MFKHLAIGVFTAVTLSFNCSSKEPPQKIEVSVKDMYVNGLVVQAGNALQTNVAVGGYANQRISWTEALSSQEAFWQTLIKKIDGQQSNRDNVRIFSNKCVGNADINLNPFSSEVISLNFTKIDSAGVLNILHYVSSASKSYSDHFKVENLGSVGLRLKDIKVSSAYDVLAAATGVRVFENSSRQLDVRRFANCKDESSESLEAPRPELTNNNCPSKASQNSPEVKNKCQPLEFYKLENIVLRGYIKLNGKTYALAETPDRISWLIKAGDYMGHDFGKVSSITDAGIVVREIAVNPYGYFYEQNIAIDFQNIRRPILEK